MSFLHGSAAGPVLASTTAVSHRRETEPPGRALLGSTVLISVLFGIAAVVVSAPIVAAGIVAVGSRREDRGWTLGGPPPAPVEAAARRIVGFHTSGIDWLPPADRSQALARETHANVR